MFSGLYLVLKPDLTILEASTAYVRAMLLWNEEFLGRRMFDVFPDNPDDDGADGVKNLGASFRRVLQTRASDQMPIQRYDVQDHVSGGGHWVERHWLSLNTPVFGRDGVEITRLIHQIEDVTDAVLLRDWIREQRRSLAEQRATVARMQHALAKQERALHNADGTLQAQRMRGPTEALRVGLGAPGAPRYFDIGEVASITGLYGMHHRRPCPFAPEKVFLHVGWPFPSCPHCSDRVLFSFVKRIGDLW